MKPSLLAAATLVVPAAHLAVIAQDILPPCAQSCVTQFTSGSEIGGCGNLDSKCICSNSSLLNNLACCLQAKCDTADQNSTILYAKQICAASGVTVPDQVICNSASSAGGASTGTSPFSTSSSEFTAASSTESAASTVSSTSATSSSAADSVVVPSLSFASSSTSSTQSSTASTTSSLLSTSTSSSTSSSASQTLPATTGNPIISNNSGLSPGEKAGIVVGVTLVVVILAAFLFFFFWRRRRLNGGPTGQGPQSLGYPELETRANTHEMSDKVSPTELADEPVLWINNATDKDFYSAVASPQAHGEFDGERQGLAEVGAATVAPAQLHQARELDSRGFIHGESGIGPAYEAPGADQSIQEMPVPLPRPRVAHAESGHTVQETAVPSLRPVNVQEVSGSYVDISQASPQTHIPPQFPLASPKGTTRKSLPPAALVSSPISASASTPSPKPGPTIPPVAKSSNSSASRLDVLRTRIDKVREEKERLARLQELDSLEAKLQREIMAEQTREFGGASAT